jgi:hypothetical protein
MGSKKSYSGQTSAFSNERSNKDRFEKPAVRHSIGGMRKMFVHPGEGVSHLLRGSTVDDDMHKDPTRQLQWLSDRQQ